MPVPLPLPRAAAPGPSSRLSAPASPNAPIVPPDDLDATGPFRRMKLEARNAPAAASLGWVGRALALLLTALVVAALLRVPDSLLLPFPWQQREREVLVRDQRAALYLKIDRAAKTWFLLKGSFPDHLQDLVSARLLSPADLEDPEGRPLKYGSGEDSYTLQPLEKSRPVVGADHRGDHRQFPARPRDPQRRPGIHGGSARPARLGDRGSPLQPPSKPVVGATRGRPPTLE